MEKFYVCGLEDFNDIVSVINLEQNSQLYGIDITESGIKDKQIERIRATLNGEHTSSRVIGHKDNTKLVSFSVMYFWPGFPAWSIVLSYTSCDFFETERFAYSYKNVTETMMNLAEAQGIYNYYFVVKHATNIRADGSRFPNYSRGDLFPRYNFNYEEIIPAYGNSKYTLFQQMISLVAGKSRRPLAVVHGSCKSEYRK